jgi:pimeloyl-ACP methyl ester carboxylesterase
MESLPRIRWNTHRGDVVELYARASADRNRAPVILIRGLDLAPDWSFYPYLASHLAEKRPVLTPVTREPYSLLDELDQLEAVLTSWRVGARPEEFRGAAGDIGLVGHGKGGGLALLLAASGLGVQGVIGIASMCTFNRSQDERILREVQRAPHRFQLEPAVRGLGVPVILIHGEEDQVAPFREAEMLYHWLPKENGRLIMLEKTGHSIGARHPFDGTNKELEIAVRVACDFF